MTLGRQWLGPLGRYRPGVFRKDLARGFKNEGGWGAAACLPAWWPQWSSPEEKVLERLNFRGQVIYDVGAFAGAYALFFARAAGAGGLVVAFEPQPDNFAKLTRNLALNQVHNVRALELALGAHAGPRALYKLPGMATTASLAPEADTPLRQRAGVAQVARLDDVIATLALPPPDFIKVDVEGLELDVLRGAAATLAGHRPNLLVEIHGSSRREKSQRMLDLMRALGSLGYTLTHAESGRQLRAGVPPPATGHVLAEAPRLETLRT